MRRTLTILAVIGALAAGACSGGDDEAEVNEEAAMADALADAGIPPEPDQATADAYIAALDAINPGIVHRHDADRVADDIEQAIDRGRDECSTIHDSPDDHAHLVETTNQRFTSPDHPAGWGPEIAEQILDVIHRYLCPD